MRHLLSAHQCACCFASLVLERKQYLLLCLSGACYVGSLKIFNRAQTFQACPLCRESDVDTQGGCLRQPPIEAQAAGGSAQALPQHHQA